MKLAKRISKGIALCAVLTIISVWGGVLASCSNGSEDPDPIEKPETPKDPEAPATKTITYSVTEDALTADDTMLIFKYERSAAGAEELVTIADCGIVVKYNGDEIKTIDKLEFALDEYGASFDDKDKNPIKDAKNMKEYKAKVSIGKQVKKGDTVIVDYKKGVGTITGAGKDSEAVKTLVVALIDTNKDAGGKNCYYNELAENVYRPLFPTEEDESGKDPVESGKDPVESGKDPVESGKDPVESGKDPVESGKDPVEPKEDIIFDFTKTETVKDENDKDVVKLDKVYYCSLQADPSKFSAENGLTLEVSASWDGAFKIATESLDLSNKNCVIEYKIDDGWTYTTKDGKKCLVQLISKEQDSGEYKAIELSQGEFANDPAETGDWQTATISNIYGNNWDVVSAETGNKLTDEEKASYNGADLTKITAIKINTTDGKGTIHIKSIKFVDKE